MRGSTKFQMPSLDAVEIEPPVKAALDDLGRQLTTQFDVRTPDDEARYYLLLYSPNGDKVWKLYVDAAGVVKTEVQVAGTMRIVRRNA